MERIRVRALRAGDRRRTRRLVRYARQMAERPDASTPRQTEDWAECKAAYRLFDCPEVTFEAVTAAHYGRTLTRLSPGKYFVISDTTELDYGYKSQREGLGRLGARHRRGFFLHSALVVDAHTRQVMGLGARNSARPPGKVTRVRRVACRKRPTESDVWGRVMDRVPCRGTGVQLVHVCDRGADNFNVFAHLKAKGDSWVLRRLS